LIGNTEMHFGNLSLWMSGTRVLGVVPLYDMLVLATFPIRGQFSLQILHATAR
jgi:hypothetical protein